ncbi:hypothetical protein [Ferrimonas senticii]|uniref:hypothetical protein n=1 Tax=Ferrimonas senticii TaxID=394566 RepID=UPI000487193D|nr:hypothetical protein [Ferrimonas senticii]
MNKCILYLLSLLWLTGCATIKKDLDVDVPIINAIALEDVSTVEALIKQDPGLLNTYHRHTGGAALINELNKKGVMEVMPEHTWSLVNMAWYSELKLTPLAWSVYLKKPTVTQLLFDLGADPTFPHAVHKNRSGTEIPLSLYALIDPKLENERDVALGNTLFENDYFANNVYFAHVNCSRSYGRYSRLDYVDFFPLISYFVCTRNPSAHYDSGEPDLNVADIKQWESWGFRFSDKPSMHHQAFLGHLLLDFYIGNNTVESPQEFNNYLYEQDRYGRILWGKKDGYGHTAIEHRLEQFEQFNKQRNHYYQLSLRTFGHIKSLNHGTNNWRDMDAILADNPQMLSHLNGAIKKYNQYAKAERQKHLNAKASEPSLFNNVMKAAIVGTTYGIAQDAGLNATQVADLTGSVAVDMFVNDGQPVQTNELQQQAQAAAKASSHAAPSPEAATNEAELLAKVKAQCSLSNYRETAYSDDDHGIHYCKAAFVATCFKDLGHRVEQQNSMIEKNCSALQSLEDGTPSCRYCP